MEDCGMRTRIRLLLFLLSGLCSVARPGLADEIDIAAVMSNQDLAATVTGVSIAIDLHTESQSDKAGAGGIAGSRFQGLFGIQIISANTGRGAISQAATSLAVRATLTKGAAPGLGF
jgi:hypothetical protein